MKLRQVVSVLILVAWAGVVAMHVKREYYKPLATRLLEGARSLAPGRHIYLVRMGGRAVGLANTQVDTLDSGYILEDVLALDVPAQGKLHSAEARTRVELGPSLELRRFTFVLDSELGRYQVSGEAVNDTTVDLVLNTGGEAQRSRITLERGAVLPIAVPVRLAAAGELRVGTQFSIPLFDPSVLAVRDAVIRVLESDTMVVPQDTAMFDSISGQWREVAWDTLPVWKIEQTMGGISVSSWIDGDGHTVKAESALGFSLERLPFEIAREHWRTARADPRAAEGYGAIIEATAIASNVPLDDRPRDRLDVRLLNVDLSGFDLAGGRQSLRGDTLRVRRESASDLRASYRLPYRAGGEPAAELEATPLIQATDPAIVAAARKIAGGETDPAIVARKLNAWVYENLDKQITPSVPSARQVLDGRRGDCNEHTVLYVALARALGLPTRTAVGLVSIRGRFYYHAWPEVWLDGWVAMDPTLGQVPADASHLRFLVGGLARQLELVRLIGRLRLEVVEPAAAAISQSE